MLSRLIAWLRGPQPETPPGACSVPPLTEGRVDKGGVNGPSRILVRSAPPVPMHGRSIFPHFDVDLPMLSRWVPQTALDIPMPDGATPPRERCSCCGK